MSYKEFRIIGNDTEIDRLLNREYLSDLRKAYVEIGEDRFCLPVTYKDYAERIHNFEVRNDDVFITGFPRTGTTWTQEMVWLIVNGLDYEGAKQPVGKRVPLFEVQLVFGNNDTFKETYANSDSFQKLGERKSPRCIKTHLEWHLLPEEITSGKKRPKIIHVLRNPMDTCVSLYHHSRLTENYTGTFDELVELFLAGRVPNGPFWKSVLSFWNNRNKSDILFLRYKDMKENLSGMIKEVADFLGKDITNAEIKQLSDHLSFDSMKKNNAVNYEKEIQDFIKPLNVTVTSDIAFIRAGKQGGYETVMTKEQIARFETWTKANLEGSGLTVA